MVSSCNWCLLSSNSGLGKLLAASRNAIDTKQLGAKPPNPSLRIWYFLIFSRLSVRQSVRARRYSHIFWARDLKFWIWGPLQLYLKRFFQIFEKWIFTPLGPPKPPKNDDFRPKIVIFSLTCASSARYVFWDTNLRPLTSIPQTVI